jgi:hypothetical protein
VLLGMGINEKDNYRKLLRISLNAEEHSDCQWLYFIVALILFVDSPPPLLSMPLVSESCTAVTAVHFVGEPGQPRTLAVVYQILIRLRHFT